jgi:hypothetical protein
VLLRSGIRQLPSYVAQLFYDLSFDFSFHFRTCIVIRKPNTYDMKANTFLRSFSIRFWIAAVVTVISLIMFLTAIQHLRLHYERVVEEDLRIMNSVFLIFTIFLQQGTENVKTFLLNNILYQIISG